MTGNEGGHPRSDIPHNTSLNKAMPADLNTFLRQSRPETVARAFVHFAALGLIWPVPTTEALAQHEHDAPHDL